MQARRAIGLLIVVLAGALAGRALAPSVVPQRLLHAGAATLAVPPAESAPQRLAVVFAPPADLAFAQRLRPALAALDASRVRLRATLAGAPSARSRVASELAREHALVAERLRPFAGPQSRDLLDRLMDSAGAYERLATAAPASATVARRSVADKDAHLVAAVERLRIDYAVQPATALPARTVRHWRTAALWLIIALGGALLAGTANRPRVASTLERVPSPPECPALPPAWRWDTAPRSRGAGPLSAFGEPPP